MPDHRVCDPSTTVSAVEVCAHHVQKMTMIPRLRAEKTLLGKPSFEHLFPHQTARRTQMQEDIRQCIKCQTKDHGIDTTGDTDEEWTRWRERQLKSAFKSVRTYMAR